MRVCPNCGSHRFYASQLVRQTVIVDGNNYFEEAIDTYDAEDPYGPYCCCGCDYEVDDLSELKEVDE